MNVALLGALTPGRAFSDVGRSLRESFYMFWGTLWALVFGFGLSGAVQAFVPRGAMQRSLGNHRPAAVVKASLYGMSSSSCSYAASAVAKSLFVGGADFLASMVFLFASTNLVLDLGIVLVVLISWQFLVAEFVGGAVMIALLVLLGGLWLRGRAIADARFVAEGALGGHHHGRGHADLEPAAWRHRARTKVGWSEAAGYTMNDLAMLGKEILVGFTVAGFLAVLVPAHLWDDVFVHGHGFWTSLENAVVGPFVAISSFVCSIGNVALAAALWKGGISFGGAVSFIFADLIALPLLLIYRKQYGTRMALRMLGVFWALMSVAGLATQYLFDVFGWVPSRRPSVIAGDSLRWGYTTLLNVVAVLAFLCLYWLYRTGYTRDPACGMRFALERAQAVGERGGRRVYFCSETCKANFDTIREGPSLHAIDDMHGA